MEQLILQSLVQTSPAGGAWGPALWAYWSWVFWVSMIVGIIGACALFFAKPGEGA